jgi:transcriptional regulator of acetoin/glycerol metabolism
VRAAVPDLQDLVDDLADRLHRPVSVEDRRWRLLAFSAHAELGDRVRQASILARAAPPDVAAWLDTLGLERAGELVDTPANPAIEMGVRTCAPVRHAGVLLGFVWVIPGPEPLDDAERAALTAMAREAGASLWRRRAAGERRGALLGALLDAPDPAARRRAAQALAAAQGWTGATRFAVALADAGDPEAVGERTRRRSHAGDLVWRAEHGRVCALVRAATDRDAAALARALVDGGAARAAAGTPFADLAAAPDARAEADDALTVLRAVPALGPSAAHADLGAWPLAARLWMASGRPPVPEPLPALLGARHGAELAEALEAVLDAGGDVARAADALHVHRATLYRRLERARELTGLDLGSGDDRLRAHLALRMWRLAGAPAVLP